MLNKLICFMYLSSLRVASLLYTLLAYTVTLSWPDYYLRPVLTSRPRRRMVTWHFILPHSMDISVGTKDERYDAYCLVKLGAVRI